MVTAIELHMAKCTVYNSKKLKKWNNRSCKNGLWSSSPRIHYMFVFGNIEGLHAWVDEEFGYKRDEFIDRFHVV